MGLWNDPVDTIINRLKDTLVYSDTGNNVSNYALDLLNRAQSWLSMARPWDYMKKIVALTLEDNYIVHLPDDVNMILDIYICSNGNRIPDQHFYKDSNNPAERYELFDEFSVTSGHDWYIQFSDLASITSQLYLKYTYNLPNIEAGQLFTFFPSELLFRCAQKLHHEDKGTTGDSIQYTMNAFNEIFDTFIRNSQYTNQKMDLTVNDKFGYPLKIGGHTLSGTQSRKYSVYQNSAILTR